MAAIMAFKSQFYDPNSQEPQTPISGQDFLSFLEARAQEFGRLIGCKYGSSTQSGPGFDFVTVPAGTFLPAGTLLADGSVLIGPVILVRDIVLPVKRQGESSDTLSFSIGTGMPITRKLSATLGYSHYFRLSDLAGHGYHQNTVTLALNYRF